MIPRLLFGLAFGLSILLIVLVIGAPLVDNGESRLLALFARDSAIRRTAVASAMRARFEGFADQFVHGMRSLPQTSETAYLYILQALAELPDQDLIAGIGVAALGARIGAAGRAKDLRGALERLDRFQAKLDINPLVLTYSTHTRKVALVDRSFLFFRKHGEPRWPWE